VIPLTQTRTGEPDGNCFATALASILECAVPEFDGPRRYNFGSRDKGVDDYWANVDGWLRSKGLEYHQEPITNPPPSGWHTVEGISPRGGLHAVVGKNGKMIHDPHPQDGTGRFLREPLKWGVLTPVKAAQDHMTVSPVDGSLRYSDGGFKQWAARRNGEAKDSKAAELLRIKHDELMDHPAREEGIRLGGNMRTAYQGTHQSIVNLVKEASTLLDKTKLDDDPVYWRGLIIKARQELAKSEEAAAAGKYDKAFSYQEGAFSLAHTVIDKMRNSGRSRGRDMVGKYIDTERAVMYPIDPGIEWVLAHKAAIALGKTDAEARRDAAAAVKRAKAKDSTTRRSRLHRALDRVLDAAVRGRDVYGWSDDTPPEVIKAAQERDKKRTAEALRRDREREARQYLKRGGGSRVAEAEARRILNK